MMATDYVDVPSCSSDGERFTSRYMRMKNLSFSRFMMATPLMLAGAIALGLAGCAEMESAPASAEAGHLAKTYWRLVAVNGTTVSPGTGRQPHIEFDPEKKRVTGYSGVNIFSGGYNATESQLRMSKMASTRRAGPPELMKLETTYLKALSATRSYRISGHELELINYDGQVVARFEGEKKP